MQDLTPVFASQGPPDPVARRAGQLELLRRQRDALQGLREREEIGDDAYHVIEWELDITELEISSPGD